MLIMLGSVLIRHFFNLRHKGVLRWEYPLAGLTIIFATLVWIAPKPAVLEAGKAVPTLAEIAAITQTRCTGCHAEKPTIMPVAQMGVMLDTPARVKQYAQRINERAFQLKNMPLANMTQMTDEERAKIGAWYAAGAK